MNVLAELIKVDLMETSSHEGVFALRATLSSYRESAVYKAHFPEKPITPGVLMIQAVVELMEMATKKRLTLREVINVKYLALMTPEDIDGCTVEETLNSEGVLSASYSKSDNTFAKIKILVRSV